MELTIGVISGTSMDGIDAALIETDGVRVGAAKGATTVPYPPALRGALLDVARDPGRAEREPLDDLERAVTEANAAAIRALLDEAGADARDVSAIGLHGQTILHRPERRFTRQLGDGALLADMTGIDVVGGFRLADVAAGGQGAPLAPLYHAALAAALPRPLAVLNLGGVGNVTYLDGETIVAFDTGPASALIDDWISRHTGQPFDEDGRIARQGRVDNTRLARLMASPYFDAPPPKSLDRNDFPISVIEGLGVADGAATLTAFTVASVAAARQHLPGTPLRWLVTGGGRHNAAIMQGLRAALAVPVEPVETAGWQGDALEAQCFAFLAQRSLRGLPLSLPTTTGVPHPLPGGVVYRAAARAAAP
ncbi:MAG: anhydro-N-acetylmuramic acid kinase [Proteobacteria bacterium]|nr:anhydro-N-acetylmuramic acid kinase [Pseudomonadota bacterium]